MTTPACAPRLREMQGLVSAAGKADTQHEPL